LPGDKVDLFTSFEMVEHLHDPIRFFHRLAKKPKCDKMLVTVPYVKSSRAGLHHIREGSRAPAVAEGTHILELSPEDWTLLMLHAGWRVIYQKIYYQYPRRWPILSQIWGYYWRNLDFEGF
jgi:2-polyprenyl-3-methyl-5-hydroxy-6-metoxy-1,4-benzoquinol methylase